MTAYSFGDIILIGFPHTDMQGISKRPALVLYDGGDDDIVVARITTQEYSTATDHKLIDWKDSGLLAESYIRLSKLATIEKRFVIKRLGRLLVSEINGIKGILKRVLSFLQIIYNEEIRRVEHGD
jgi:mRNA interferase MazF